MKNIYIILSQTGTVVSSIIRLYTGDRYNHASISFDRSLQVMYSFGRKHRYNILNNGFIEENFCRGLFAVFPDARCLILELAVTDLQYETMLDTMDTFLDHKESYRYNVLGLVGYMFGIGLAPKNRFFCSQFVAHVLGQRTELWPGIPELTRPMDFLGMLGRGIVFEGSVAEYRVIHQLNAEHKQWNLLACRYVLSVRYLAARLRAIYAEQSKRYARYCGRQNRGIL